MATTTRSQIRARARAGLGGALGAAMLLLAACSGTAAAATAAKTSARAVSSGQAATGECRILTATDVQEITGVDVHPVARGASPGAGGTCGNYQEANGDGFLGINALSSSAEYDMSVAAVPDDIYPIRERVDGLGEAATLSKDRAERPTMRYLVVRRGQGGVVLFPLTGAITDAQLEQLASRALAAR
jgi:hypothetical protein